MATETECDGVLIHTICTNLVDVSQEYHLGKRQCEILAGYLLALRDKTIAQHLHVKHTTVKAAGREMRSKLEALTRTHAAIIALEHDHKTYGCNRICDLLYRRYVQRDVPFRARMPQGRTDILDRLMCGDTDRRIAEHTGIDEKLVKNNIINMIRVQKLTNRVDIAIWWYLFTYYTPPEDR